MSKKSTKAIIFYAYGLSGFAALIYEVVWFRALSLVLGSTTYAITTMLATFMAGLSIGAYIGGILTDRTDKPEILYVYLEGAIAFIAVVTFSVIKLLPPIYAWLYYTFRFSFEAFSFSQFLLCAVVMLPSTVLMGATFPVVCRICFTGGGIGRDTGGVYAVNTVGAIAGSLAAGFVLIPNIGLMATNLVGALANLVVALTCFFLFRIPMGRNVAATGAFLLLAVVFANNVSGEAAYPFNYYIANQYASYNEYIRRIATAEKVYDRDNEAGNIKVVRENDGNIILINNGKIESNNSTDRLNLAMLAFLPISANPSARSFLNIGLGTGGTVFYAATIPTLEEIYSIEINPSVMDASRLFFYPEIFRNPRIRFIAADARNYLSIIDRRYDIISSEPSYPVDQGFSHLYSREFFEIVKERLNNGGVYCQWVPAYIFEKRGFDIILRTFQTVFPEFTVWRAEEGDYLFIGVNGASLDSVKMLSILKSRLEFAGLPSAGYSIVLDRADIERRFRNTSGQMNTDDRPVIEFIGAKRVFEG